MGLVTYKRDPTEVPSLFHHVKIQGKVCNWEESLTWPLFEASRLQTNKYHPVWVLSVKPPEQTRAGIIPANPLQSVLSSAHTYQKTLRSAPNSGEKCLICAVTEVEQEMKNFGRKRARGYKVHIAELFRLSVPVQVEEGKVEGVGGWNKADLVDIDHGRALKVMVGVPGSDRAPINRSVSGFCFADTGTLVQVQPPCHACHVYPFENSSIRPQIFFPGLSLDS